MLTIIAIAFIVFGIMRVLKVYGWELGVTNILIGLFGLVVINANLIA